MLAKCEPAQAQLDVHDGSRVQVDLRLGADVGSADDGLVFRACVSSVPTSRAIPARRVIAKRQPLKQRVERRLGIASRLDREVARELNAR